MGSDIKKIIRFCFIFRSLKANNTVMHLNYLFKILKKKKIQMKILGLSWLGSLHWFPWQVTKKLENYQPFTHRFESDTSNWSPLNSFDRDVLKYAYHFNSVIRKIWAKFNLKSEIFTQPNNPHLSHLVNWCTSIFVQCVHACMWTHQQYKSQLTANSLSGSFSPFLNGLEYWNFSTSFVL